MSKDSLKKAREAKAQKKAEQEVVIEAPNEVEENTAQAQDVTLQDQVLEEPSVGTDEYFTALVKAIHEALKSDEGRRLGCRLHVLVPGHKIIIYQGMLSNIFGHFKKDGNHSIHRFALKKLVKNHPSTAQYFKDLI